MEDNDTRRLICIDLDGVLNLFDEWKGSEYFHPPRPGAADFLERLNTAGFKVAVFTVRWHEWARTWLEENGLSQYVEIVTNRKIAAHVYLDDRAVCFEGDFNEAYKKILNFRTFWEDPAAVSLKDAPGPRISNGAQLPVVPGETPFEPPRKTREGIADDEVDNGDE